MSAMDGLDNDIDQRPEIRSLLADVAPSRAPDRLRTDIRCIASPSR